ncbi:MAG: carbohydrate kinase [Planctomycetaceae bacterium]|nr:carbohydrate kinase [Planctomycetaceae bacterium]
MADRFRVVGLGEMLWDVFPSGPVFGGAPANVACHAAALGADAAMVSCVGNDDLGARAIAALAERGVDTSAVARSGQFPTGTVQVHLSADGQPSYEITRDVAWDHVPWSSEAKALAARADAVCFGSLAQRSETTRDTIRRFLKATRPGCLRVFDVNLRQNFYDDEILRESLEMANALKLNDEEALIVAEACFGERSADPIDRLVRQFDLRLVALTLGSKGAILAAGGERHEEPAPQTTVADTVGAGDSFTAAMILGSLAGWPLAKIAARATAVAAYVCSQPGATPVLPESLTGGF